jgi:hypothetical protein
VSDALPQLLDCKRIMAETGLTRAAVEQVMRTLPTVQFIGLRKVYARRDDVLAEIERRTFTKDQVAA